jgi:KDO2-lipid IV(A) lauroyltransferase
MAYRLSARKRRLSEEALARAMPAALSASERRAVVEGSFQGFWREAFSLVLSDADRRALAAVEVRGMEHLRAAAARGRGVILWESSHFGNRLLAKQILQDHGVAVHQVHADNHLGGFRIARDGGSLVRQRILRPFVEREECRSVAGIIHIPDSDSLAFTRALRRRLRDGAVVCTSSDGPLGQRFVVVPFLGDEQPFATGVVSLARASGAALLPLFCFDDPPGRPCLVVEPAVTIEPGEDRERLVQDALRRYASLLERYIRRYPAQYRHWHGLGRRGRHVTART